IVGKVSREAFRVARFHCEIKLALERAAQLAYDLDRPVASDFGHLTLDQMRKAIEESEISVDLCLDPRTPNLQDHWRAAGEFGPVYLRNRGGSVGLALNVGKYFERRAAKRLFNLRQEIIERNWRHVAVQSGQFSRPNRRQQILSCREHLAKLYEGWSE